MEKARSEGFNEGFSKGKVSTPKIDIESILEEIGKIKGIGTTKITSIQSILIKHLT